MGDSFVKVTTMTAIYWQNPERLVSALKEETIPSWTMENFEGGGGAQRIEGFVTSWQHKHDFSRY